MYKNNLMLTVHDEALAEFIKNANIALVKLENVVGTLPEDVLTEWNRILRKVIEATH